MVLIGAIVLVGIVVNNAIVLVDAVNRIHAEGASLDDAIRRGGALRLRPILITSLTNVLGCCPSPSDGVPAPRCRVRWRSRSSAAWCRRPCSRCSWSPCCTGCFTPGRAPAA
jgi:hypothetical protein